MPGYMSWTSMRETKYLIEGECESSAESRGLADAALKKGADKYMQRTLKDGI